MSFIITRVQEFFSFRDINPVCADVQLLFVDDRFFAVGHLRVTKGK